MGKKKIVIVGEEPIKSSKPETGDQQPKIEDRKTKAESRQQKTENREVKEIKIAGTRGGQKIKIVEAEPIKTSEEKESKEEKKSTKKVKVRGKKYLAAKAKIDATKFYPLTEAIKLVRETSLSKFVGNLEAHILIKQPGDFGEVKLPYFKGKAKKVVIADEKIVEEIKAGAINFDILLASPKIMPKLVPLAKILGPKGLMPNPKNGTLIENPEKAVDRFGGNEIKVRSEKKIPVIHLVLGKLDQKDEELKENVETLLKIFGPGQLLKLVLKATMGPAVKIKV